MDGMDAMDLAFWRVSIKSIASIAGPSKSSTLILLALRYRNPSP